MPRSRQQMWETNVLGTLLVTKGLLPKLISSGDGHVISVTSIAGYDGSRTHREL